MQAYPRNQTFLQLDLTRMHLPSAPHYNEKKNCTSALLNKISQFDWINLSIQTISLVRNAWLGLQISPKVIFFCYLTPISRNGKLYLPCDCLTF